NGLSDYPQKRSCNSKNFLDNNNSILNKDQITNIDVGIQVIIDSDYDLLIQIDVLKNSLANIVTDHA
ncbi:7474_t:CDS:1, partial [Dentiscutata heterogama]